MAKVVLLVGTRPNIVKVTRFREVFASQSGHELLIVHSNQHFTDSVSKHFLNQFGMNIDFFLDIFDGSAAGLIGHIITQFSELLGTIKPDLVLVVGDVNTTAAGAIVANKMQIPLAHVESGLRSFDRSMPEEINRILVDELADYFFVSEESGIENLLKEGKNPEAIFHVGNSMIDSLVGFRESIQSADLPFALPTDRKILTITMHRPSNVDSAEGLVRIVELIEECGKQYSVVLPLHHRTRNNFIQYGLIDRISSIDNLILTEPLDYFGFQRLLSKSHAVITDSGGIQEETTFLRIPCITLRENTERPSTVTIGSNILIPFHIESIMQELTSPTKRNSGIPPLWDGRTTERIVEIVNSILA